jgi:hypothetical protein
MTNPTTTKLDSKRPLRIKLSLERHLQLHQIKLMTGAHMADVIDQALDQYFKSVAVRVEAGGADSRRRLLGPYVATGGS